jgi:virginiamycin B lyase
VVLVMILLGTVVRGWLFLGQNQQLSLTRTATGTLRQGHSGVITEFPTLTSDAQADDITQGPDGNLWFTEDNIAKVGRMTPQGHITEFSLTPGSNPAVIVLGSDRNLWVLENGSSKIARVTPQGHITEFLVTPGSNLVGLAAGKDGNLWFTEFQTNKIGRMNTSGEITSEFSIPTSNCPRIAQRDCVRAYR